MPAQPLPVAATPRPVDILYSPHPDDETLSMGVLIAQDIARGDRVIVVALTDGRATSSLERINHRLAAQGVVRQLSRDDLAAARLDEMRRAVSALGVAPTDLYAAHLDAASSDCGSEVSVNEAEQVIRAFAVRFPDALHVTMSWTAERQPDHVAAGVALRDLLAAGVVHQVRWTVSRLWWQLPVPRWQWALAGALGPRVVRAADAYGVWDPAHGEYAVGFTSVAEQFRALLLDPRDMVHGGDRLGAGYEPPIGSGPAHLRK